MTEQTKIGNAPYDRKIYEPDVSDYARRADHLTKYTVVTESIPCEWTHIEGETGHRLTCQSSLPMAVHRLVRSLPVAPAGTALCAMHSPYDLRSMLELHTEALEMELKSRQPITRGMIMERQARLNRRARQPMLDACHTKALAMEAKRNAPRYIAYVSTGLVGDITPGMMPVSSIREAVDYLRGYSERTSYLNDVTPSISLYACMFDADMWATARDFSDVGCPFDYPSYVLSVGARGGIKVDRP